MTTATVIFVALFIVCTVLCISDAWVEIPYKVLEAHVTDEEMKAQR
jgi:hypothetical protein